MAQGRSPWFNEERDCEPWEHRFPPINRALAVDNLLLTEDGDFADDAVPMTKKEIIERRREAWLLHYIWGNGNPNYIADLNDPLHRVSA